MVRVAQRRNTDMARYIVDRVEGSDWVVLEDERARTFTVPRSWLPSAAREGDILNAFEQHVGAQTKVFRFELDPAAREERLAKARRLRDQLPRAPKGDVLL